MMEISRKKELYLPTWVYCEVKNLITFSFHIQPPGLLISASKPQQILYGFTTYDLCIAKHIISINYLKRMIFGGK